MKKEIEKLIHEIIIDIVKNKPNELFLYKHKVVWFYYSFWEQMTEAKCLLEIQLKKNYLEKIESKYEGDRELVMWDVYRKLDSILTPYKMITTTDILLEWWNRENNNRIIFDIFDFNDCYSDNNWKMIELYIDKDDNIVFWSEKQVKKILI